jgi:hypothetical protein
MVAEHEIVERNDGGRTKLAVFDRTAQRIAPQSPTAAVSQKTTGERIVPELTVLRDAAPFVRRRQAAPPGRRLRSADKGLGAKEPAPRHERGQGEIDQVRHHCLGLPTAVARDQCANHQ